ncbi:MerR family DNA-binding transcriptional regulator, partial [Campylobacter coli]
MNKLIAIGQASKLLGVTIQTLRNWDKQGLLKPDEITKGGSRRYKLESLKNINKNIKFNTDNLKTIAYARVSSHDQKDDLIRQVQVLELYCAKAGFNYEIIQDLGSG